MTKLRTGKTYTGDELAELCGVEGNDRVQAVVGKKAMVIALDVGNDNYKVLWHRKVGWGSGKENEK